MRITAALVRELAASGAMDPALVRYHDGRYEVRSTVRDSDGLAHGRGYQIIAQGADLDPYCGGVYTDDLAEVVAAGWREFAEEMTAGAAEAP